MKAFKIIVMSTLAARDTWWIYVFLYFGIYSLMALWNLPPSIRQWFLTGGFVFGVLAAISILICQIGKDYLLLALVAGVVLFWLFAFPAAINGNDDNTAYLVFAKDFYDDIAKTIQPLSERRLFSVGGNYALQAPVLRWIGISGLSLVEPVLGLILFFIVVTAQRAIDPLTRGYFLVGALALVPLGGAKVLANTASVFVLSAFTLALLELGRSILEKRKVTWPEIILLIVLPLCASVFRPITAPFNFLIAGFILSYIIARLQGGKKLLISGVGALLIFYFALDPYHEVGGTYLYPIMGRGYHITADEYSIVASVTLQEHLSNCFSTIFTDPLFALNMLIATIAYKLASKEGRGAMVLILIGVYLAFYFLIVVSTGGLASTRYVFPVTLALLVTQLITLFSQVKIPPLAAHYRSHMVTKVGWVVGVMTSLLIVRVTVGPGVVAKRLEMYQPAHDVIPSIEKVQYALNSGDGSAGAVLLVGIGYARFIVSKLKVTYFIMDQPGTMSPWKDQGLGYEDGLNMYLIQKNINTIVMHKPDCKRPKQETYSGWSGVTQLGYLRNERAICRLMRDFETQIFGPFTVLTRRVIKTRQ